MSTLKADTIQSTGGGAATLTKQHAAKGWCHANQVSVGITDSFNVSSITDASAGLLYYTPTNSMSDANFAICVAVRESGSGSTHAQSVNDLHTASRWASSSKNNSNTGTDAQHNNVAVHGDLA